MTCFIDAPRCSNFDQLNCRLSHYLYVVRHMLMLKDETATF